MLRVRVEPRFFSCDFGESSNNVERFFLRLRYLPTMRDFDIFFELLWNQVNKCKIMGSFSSQRFIHSKSSSISFQLTLLLWRIANYIWKFVLILFGVAASFHIWLYTSHLICCYDNRHVYFNQYLSWYAIQFVQLI